MAEQIETQTPESSLKRYFNFMLSNRSMVVKFSVSKIREIITNDLGINFGSESSLYANICTEAFPYYMQSWPDWNRHNGNEFSEDLYLTFRNYLRNKLITLKKVETDITQAQQNKFEITVPTSDNRESTSRLRRVKCPYVLNVTAPEQSWSSLNFTSPGSEDLTLEFKELTPSTMNLGIQDVVNHPFVSMELHIPGLIHILRNAPYKMEYFLHSPNSFPEIDRSFIISIESNNQKYKVYTYDFLKKFFTEFSAVLAKYTSQVNDTSRLEIFAICHAFLEDIKETNLCDNTSVCEGATVTFNVGKSAYYNDKEIEFAGVPLSEKLIFKKYLTPVVSYCLKFCTLLQDDLTPAGFNYFNFSREGDQVFEPVFLHYVQFCVKYKCILCSSYYPLDDLRKHLLEKHPLDPTMRCKRCFNRFSTYVLLHNRWRHTCVSRH